MKQAALQQMSVDQLVERFEAIALDQDLAIFGDETAKFNRLFDSKKAVERELKVRPSDQRSALLRLYDHANPQVRLNAAKATLAVGPDMARDLLRSIADSREYPRAADAGMALRNLERGIFKPE